MKERIRREVNTNLIDFLENRWEDSHDRLYIGKVEDNKDPEKLGRCRIRVFGVFDKDIPTEDLPWAIMNNSFCGSMYGGFIIPPIGAIVSVHFNNGDLYSPMYTTKVIDKANLPTDKDTDYPDNMIFYQTDNGDVFQINRAKKTSMLTTAGGTTITWDDKGNMQINTKDSPDGGKIKLNGEDYSIGRYEEIKATFDMWFGPSGVFTTWVPVPMDGGASLKAAIMAALPSYNTGVLKIESANNKVN
jgi:hypothetical protein